MYIEEQGFLNGLQKKSLIKNNKENFMQKQLKQNLKHETQTILTPM